MWKIKSLEAENFGGIRKLELELNPLVNVFYGPNGSGKSTTGLHLPTTLMIGIGQRSTMFNVIKDYYVGKWDTAAFVKMILEHTDGRKVVVRRILFKGKSPEVYIEGISPDGTMYKDPQYNEEWLRKLYSPVVMNPVAFTQLTSDEQASMLGTQLSSYNARIDMLKSRYTKINADSWASKVTYDATPDSVTLEEALKAKTASDMEAILQRARREGAERYVRYLNHKGAKAKEQLEQINKDKAKVIKERLQYIQGIVLPIADLKISEDGLLLYKGRPLKTPYFSSGETLKIACMLTSYTIKQFSLGYVYIQDFNLLDAKSQAGVVNYFKEKGIQIVCEYVSDSCDIEGAVKFPTK